MNMQYICYCAIISGIKARKSKGSCNAATLLWEQLFLSFFLQNDAKIQISKNDAKIQISKRDVNFKSGTYEASCVSVITNYRFYEKVMRF